MATVGRVLAGIVLILMVLVGSLALAGLVTAFRRRYRRAMARKGYSGPAWEFVMDLVLMGSGPAVWLTVLEIAGRGRLRAIPWARVFETVPLVLVVIGFFVAFLAAMAPGLPAAALLHRLVPRRRRRAEWGRRFPWRPTGHAFYAAGISWIVYQSWSGHWREPRTYQIAGSLLGAAYFLYHYGRRSTTKSMNAKLTEDPRAPVLYLRAFASEEDLFAEVPRRLRHLYTDWENAFYSKPSERFLTAEQYLFEALGAAVGPTVALGNPQDFLPPEGGAARAYVGDEAWKHEVATLAARASCIVMVAGVSPSLAWEFEHLVRAGLQSKLFLLTPPELIPSTDRGWATTIARWFECTLTGGVRMDVLRGPRQDDWKGLVRLVEPLGYQLPHTHPGAGAVLAFDEQARGQLMMTGARSPQHYVAPIAYCLRRQAVAVPAGAP